MISAWEREQGSLWMMMQMRSIHELHFSVSRRSFSFDAFLTSVSLAGRTPRDTCSSSYVRKKCGMCSLSSCFAATLWYIYHVENEHLGNQTGWLFLPLSVEKMLTTSPSRLVQRNKYVIGIRFKRVPEYLSTISFSHAGQTQTPVLPNRVVCEAVFDASRSHCCARTSFRKHHHHRKAANKQMNQEETSCEQRWVS